MIRTGSAAEGQNVCNLNYLTEMMGHKKHLIKEIMDEFLIQVPEELERISVAVASGDYPVLKSLVHTMKSSASIMGIKDVVPVLKKMEELSARASGLEEIKELSLKLSTICLKAIQEIENEKHKFI